MIQAAPRIGVEAAEATLARMLWSRVAGEVTPTQKLKRRRVGEKYADVLESLYESRPEHDAT